MKMFAIRPEGQGLPRKTLNYSALAFSALAALTILHFIGLQSQQQWVSKVKASQVLAFAIFHLLLGLSAKQSGRSFLLYGLLPVFPPILGGSVALVVLWRKLRAADA
jgi:hypothetical protein